MLQSLSYEQISEIINELDDIGEAIYSGGFSDEELKPFNDQGIAVKCEDLKNSGYDDGAVLYYTVFSFSKGPDKIYIEWQWYFASFYGNEITGYNEVTPEEVTTIRWNDV